MNRSPDPLSEIASARADLRGATAAVGEAMRAGGDSGERIYRAFRSWTWKALTQRRYDDELRGWFDLFDRTCVLLERKGQDKASLKISALRDMLFISIDFGEHDDIEDVLNRAHVRPLLLALHAAGVMARQEIADETGLGSANLTRVLNLLQSANLVERISRGNKADFRLSRGGAEACRSYLRTPAEERQPPARSVGRTVAPPPLAPVVSATTIERTGRKIGLPEPVYGVSSDYLVVRREPSGHSLGGRPASEIAQRILKLRGLAAGGAAPHPPPSRIVEASKIRAEEVVSPIVDASPMAFPLSARRRRPVDPEMREVANG